MKKVSYESMGHDEISRIMNDIIAQNPYLNDEIEKVSNKSNMFLCKILRLYPYDDKALVKLIDTGKNIFCRLSHEIIGNGLSIDYTYDGVEQEDKDYLIGRRYIRLYDVLYGIVVKVRWENLIDENVLIGYANVGNISDLKSSSDKGEVSIKSGSSIISVTDERVNIMTPSLFINGLPFDEPNLKNHYDKNETNIIINSLKELLNTNDIDRVKEFYKNILKKYNEKSSDKYTLFRGDCWTVNNNFESSASITSTSDDNVKITGTFRTKNDLIGLYWNSQDKLTHPYITYGNRSDYTGVILEFDYSMSGCKDFTNGTVSITITTNNNETYYVTMANYINNSHFKLNFDNLHIEKNIDITNIKSIMFVIIPDVQNYTSTFPYQIMENVDFTCNISNITVTNGDICNEHIPLEPHKYRLCEGYDDIYDMNPRRLVKEMRKLGYVEWVDLYIGASHYYEKKGTVNDTITNNQFNHDRTEKMVLDTTKPLNNAFREWLNCYCRELKANDVNNLIISVSMENLQCPVNWRQKDLNNNDAVTGWIPSTFFYSPCNAEVLAYMKRVSEECLDILVSNNMQPILQMGEAWWWWNENDRPNQPPCFYDNATKTKYSNEFGTDMPEYESSWSENYDETMMQWLNQQLCEYSDGLRSVVKSSKYLNGLYMALFFPPSVTDVERVPSMIQKVNYLENAYNPSKLDVLELEDYDWVTGDSVHHNEVYDIGNKLGFANNQLHYYGGFVQYENDAVPYWRLINTAMDTAFEKEFGEVFVWAGSQVRRDDKYIGYDCYEVISLLVNKNN